MTTFVVIALLFLLLALGLPVALSLAVSGAVGLFLVGGMDMLVGMVGSTPLASIQSYEFLTIPMFILMANFVLASGASDDMFDMAKKWTGRVPGGLAHATALTGAGFGAISGSSTAGAATLASASIPGMIKQGYSPPLAAGVAAISGTLAMLIPPSIAMVLYALLANMSVGKLLIAGIIPGLLVTATIMLTICFLVWRRPEDAPRSRGYSFAEKFLALRKSWTFLVLFGLVTITIYVGIGTPTEASALGALGALLLALYHKAPLKKLWQATILAAETSCMIAFVVIGALIFGYFLALSQTTQHLLELLSTSGMPRFPILLIIIFLYMVLGCFVEMVAMLTLTVPIVVPLIVHLGYNPIWFAVITVIMGEIAMVTPPLGLNVFVISKYTGIPTSQVFRGSFPYVIAHLLLVILLLAFPDIVLWLPSHMK